MAAEISGNILKEVVRNLHVHPSAAIDRSKLAQRSSAIDNVPLTRLRVHDAFQTNLPGTAASDDLALIGGTLGTDCPQVQTGDLKAAGSTTRYARFEAWLPEDYEDGQTITLRVYAGMVTTVADTAATLDLEAYPVDPTSQSVGADISGTSAIDVNSLTIQARDFTITPTSRVAGERLDCRLAFLVNDGATGTEVLGTITAMQLLTDRR